MAEEGGLLREGYCRIPDSGTIHWLKGNRGCIIVVSMYKGDSVLFSTSSHGRVTGRQSVRMETSASRICIAFSWRLRCDYAMARGHVHDAPRSAWVSPNGMHDAHGSAN